MSWNEWTHRQLDAIRASKRWRTLRACDPRDESEAHVSFASNDYLGLSQHPRVKSAASAAIERFGTGSGSARLIAGTRSVHLELEEALAHWQRAERALVLPTGYAANLAVLTVFATEGATVFSDELNHASIIDGCRLAKARTEIYNHCDLHQLEALLRRTSGRKLVVSDTVFSMDGDVAPVPKLVELCDRYDALLVLDEAHAVLQPVHAFDGAVLRVGTLSKSLGALGGWVAGARAMIELLVNRARSFIFTTALSPADAAAALAAVNIVMSQEGAALRAQLRASIDRLRPNHFTPIIPIVLGDEALTLRAAACLEERGLFVPAIRPPTVPVGASRLRITLSAAHSRAAIDRLIESLAHLPCSLVPSA